MAVDDEKIDTLVAILEQQLSREQAAKLLLLSNNDVNNAVGRFFDSGLTGLEDVAWDDSAFANDDSTLPTFNIDYAPGHDHYPHSGAGSVAPSRPPSRTSHHSGASPAHQGDTPMQSIETGQETGFVGNTKPVFGPATRDHYDADQWAVVPTTTSAEFLPDAAPFQRKRDEGSPAFIKPLPSGDYLPALITILHSIPLCRNNLLAPEITQDNYYVGDDWWKGRPTPQARTVEYGTDTDADTVQDRDIIYETQRLMAFLDNTTRAYGSVGGLQQLETMKNSRAPITPKDDELLTFLDNWAPAYQRQTSQPINGILRSVVNVNGDSKDVWLLDASVVANSTGNAVSIYDVLDDNLFETASRRAHIIDISNVIILRLTNPRPGADTLDCRFPATFYADRYLEKNKEVISRILQEKEEYNERVKELNAKEQQLKYTTTKTVRPGERVEVLELLKTSMAAFRPKEDDLVEDPQDSAALSQLQAIYENVERKLKVLEEQKKKAQELVDGISSRFRPPFDDGQGPQQNGVVSDEVSQSATASVLGENDSKDSPPLLEHTHAYRLCGVSTRRGVYYLLDPHNKSDKSIYNQWWRIEYSTATSETYVLRERVSLSGVLEKASSENHTALLIYANDSALNTPTIPLSEQLQEFVNKDNLKFEEEWRGDWGYGSDANIEPLGGWNQVNAYNGDPPNYADDWAHYGGSSTSLPEKDTAPNKYDTSSMTTAFGTHGLKMNNAKSVQEPHYSDFKDNGYQSTDALQEKDYPGPDSAMSSTTLTPNTEIEDEGVDMGGNGEGDASRKPMEMQEVNGGVAAWAGMSAGAGVSEENGGVDEMELVDRESQQTVNMRDVEMVDVDLGRAQDMGTEHIERVEAKKGG